MTPIVAKAIAGANGFDTDTVLSADVAAQLYGLGYRFAVRYISRTIPGAPGDITAGEASDILTAGLGLMLVQHCPAGLWTPSAATGAAYGGTAVANVHAVLYPEGAMVWCDMENMRPGCGAAAIEAHINTWWSAVTEAGFGAGLYYTADMQLTAEQLYLSTRPSRYWRGLSRDAPAVAVRGACMQQFAEPGQVAGVDIDRDVIMPDALGGLPSMARAGG